MRFLLSTIALLLVTACSSVDVHTDHDPKADLGSYHTYQWVSPENEAALRAELPKQAHGLHGPVLRDPVLEVKIERIVNGDLQKAGFTPVKEGKPDFYVTFYTLTREKTWVGNFNDYGWMADGGYAGWGPSSYTTDTEGSLVLVFIDSKTKQPVWNGRATGLLDTPEKSDNKIAQAVSEMLKDFRKEALA